MRIRNFLFNCTIAFASLLLFLLLFESNIQIPAWLQVAGRMHPAMLHFPIVLLILYCGMILLVPSKVVDEATTRLISDWLLLLGAATASLTALMGLFLSRETGYDPEALYWHKWSGVLVTFLLLLAYTFRRRMMAHKVSRIGFSSLGIIGILTTGHQGAGITHGEDFLLAPVLPREQPVMVSLEDAVVFDHLVKPVLDRKCISCHNARKAKGELVMETAEALLKGGENGKLWDSTESDLGLLLRRIHLPLTEKKHMPPTGKPQLSEEEMAVLYYWIKGGASFTQKLMELAEQDTLRVLASRILVTPSVTVYPFKAAPEETIRQLSNVNRVVTPLALDVPALSVNFYNREYYTKQSLEALSAIKDQLVELDLSRMPVTDDQLELVARFSNLEKLNLNFTTVTGTGFDKLRPLLRLKYLSLTGTPVTQARLAVLEQLPALKRVVIWNTGITREEAAVLLARKKPPFYETGFSGDTLVMQLTTPLIQNEEQVLTGKVPLRIKHYINGSRIHYTTDGTDPDSIQSPIYQSGVMIEGNTMVKAKAFKPGWISSEVIQQYFFKNTYRPDSALFIQPPDPKYRSLGPKSLFNGLKGDANFGSGLWLGYRENKMESLLFFHKPVPVKSVSISCLINSGSYIMPPTAVEVWTGPDPQHLQLAKRFIPAQPKKYEPATVVPIELSFPERQAGCIKLVAVPVAKLPSWHGGKGDKGWVFVDEVFIN